MSDHAHIRANVLIRNWDWRRRGRVPFRDLGPDRANWSNIFVIVLAALLYVAVYVARAVDSGDSHGITAFMVLPVTLLAIRFGVRGGVIGAAIAIGSTIVWLIAANEKLDLAFFLARSALTLVAGLLIGYMALGLRDSERRFRTSVESLLEPFGVFSALRDEDGSIHDFRVDYVNQAAVEIAGIPREELMGSPLSAAFPGRLESSLFGEYCDVIETGEPFFREAVTHEHVFGEKLLIRAYDVRVVKLDDSVAVAWRDITERRKTAEDAAESRRRLDMAIEELPISMYAQDRELRYTWAAMSILDVEPEDLIGKTSAELFPGVDTEQMDELKQRVLATGEAAAGSVVSDAAGAPQEYYAAVEPQRDDAGEVSGVICLVSELVPSGARSLR